MKDKIFEQLRTIESLSYREGKGDDIRNILADIAHDVNSMVKDSCDSKENVTVKFSEVEKLFITQAILDTDLENTVVTNKECVNLIKKVCEL